MTPHLAEEAWADMAQEGLIADAAWPDVDPALLIEDEVTVAVQVKGKLRDTLTVAKGTPKDELERLALASAKVIRTLDGATPRSEEHTSELQSLMRISHAVICLKK